jgi:hypothetical protein
MHLHLNNWLDMSWNETISIQGLHNDMKDLILLTMPNLTTLSQAIA